MEVGKYDPSESGASKRRVGSEGPPSLTPPPPLWRARPHRCFIFRLKPLGMRTWRLVGFPSAVEFSMWAGSLQCPCASSVPPSTSRSGTSLQRSSGSRLASTGVDSRYLTVQVYFQLAALLGNSQDTRRLPGEPKTRRRPTPGDSAELLFLVPLRPVSSSLVCFVKLLGMRLGKK